MYITIQRKSVLAALRRISPADYRWSHHTYVHLEATDNRLRLTIIDETRVLRQEIPTEIVSHGSVIVVYHHLLQLLQKEKQETFLFYSTPDGYRLANGTDEIPVRVTSLQEWSRVQQQWLISQVEKLRWKNYHDLVTEMIHCSFDTGMIREALQSVIHAVGVRWGDTALDAVLFHFSPPWLAIAASDGFHISLVRMKLPEDYVGPREGTIVWRELKILIPATSIRTLLQAFPVEKKKGAANRLQIQGTFQRMPETPSVVSGMIVFRQPSLAREMVSALEIGTFPSYEPLLLSEAFGIRMHVATQSLSEAIEKVKSRDGYMITLHFEPTMRRLIVIETAREQTNSLKCEAVEAIMVEGQDIRIEMSWRYLQRILASIPTPLIMIESIPPKHSLRITPSGLQNKDLVFSHAIAPAESFH